MNNLGYTDRTLIDLWVALDRLPALPLDEASYSSERQAATGTDHNQPVEVIENSVYPSVYSSQDKSSISQPKVDNSSGRKEKGLPHINVAADKPCELALQRKVAPYTGPHSTQSEASPV